MIRRRFLPLVLALGTVVATTAQAQTHRFFPATALRGEFLLTQFPDALINGQPAKLAPGVRLFGDTGLLLSPASITGQKAIVHYVVEQSSGLVMTLWILNPAELANKVWPGTPQEAAGMQFEPATQTWRKP
ncbi:MAG: hypothetical protein JO006_17030 [Paucibacter sp.]|nr:hypothetical protein [Roseateles sp.]